MKAHDFCCEEMNVNIQEARIVHYNEVFDEYGIVLTEDNVSFILIKYCPWCGKRLPHSRREEWFSKLELLGFEVPLFCENIPPEFKSDEWWK